MNQLFGQTIGRYRITEQLGQGGMAVVYKAFDTQLERDVAIKVIRVGAFPPDILDYVLERFKREAKTLARLNHPNIVKVHDFGEIDGAPFLVMDYLSGHTFKEIRKPIRPEAAARLLLPIAEALSYAHSQGVFHRDIKPSNIILNNNQSPILMDFGISKLLEEERGYTLTGTGIGLGTPEYMAPEQGLGKAIDGRADLYSMGIVFYEMITGHKPYQADTAFAVLYKQMNDPLPDPRQFVPDLSDEVEQFLSKALAKKPNDRYADMEEFKNKLSSFISSKQTSQEQRPQDNSQPILQLENSYEKNKVFEQFPSKRIFDLPKKKVYKKFWIISVMSVVMVGLLVNTLLWNNKKSSSIYDEFASKMIAHLTELFETVQTKLPTLTATMNTESSIAIHIENSTPKPIFSIDRFADSMTSTKTVVPIIISRKKTNNPIPTNTPIPTITKSATPTQTKTPLPKQTNMPDWGATCESIGCAESVGCNTPISSTQISEFDKVCKTWYPPNTANKVKNDDTSFAFITAMSEFIRTPTQTNTPISTITRSMTPTQTNTPIRTNTPVATKTKLKTLTATMNVQRPIITLVNTLTEDQASLVQARETIRITESRDQSLATQSQFSGKIAFVKRESTGEKIYIIDIESKEETLFKKINNTGWSLDTYSINYQEGSLFWNGYGDKLICSGACSTFESRKLLSIYGKNSAPSKENESCTLHPAPPTAFYKYLCTEPFTSIFLEGKKFSYGNENNYYPIWAPDGKKFAYLAQNKGDVDLIVDEKNLTESIRGEILRPSWSMDGSKIVFVYQKENSSQSGEICYVEVNNSQITCITDNNYEESYPSWSPDGKSIAFSRRINGIYNLFVVNIDTLEEKQITNEDVDCILPLWRPSIMQENNSQTGFVTKKGFYETQIITPTLTSTNKAFINSTNIPNISMNAKYSPENMNMDNKMNPFEITETAIAEGNSCIPWKDAFVYNLYAERFNNSWYRYVYAMTVVIKIPKSLSDNQWQMNYTGNLYNKKGFHEVKAECTKINGFLHCGTVKVSAEGNGFIEINPKGETCIVFRSGIPRQLFVNMYDQTK